MITLLECIDRLIAEEGEYRGVIGKLNKYSGDIVAGAVSHLAGRAVGANTNDPGASTLAKLGIYGAYKTRDIASNNYQNTGKSISGSGIGALIGSGLAEAGFQALK